MIKRDTGYHNTEQTNETNSEMCSHNESLGEQVHLLGNFLKTVHTGGAADPISVFILKKES